MKKQILVLVGLFFILFTIQAQESETMTSEQEKNYTSEDVQFKNSSAENIKLAGTFTKPNGIKNAPVVILISGSGAQNRDAEFFGHKWFVVLSDYLTSHGIAVLRYDERGIGESEGNFSKATTFDLASDTEAAIAYLKTRDDIDVTKIGLIGHSEGGVIAPIIASKNKSAAFIILMAGPGMSGDKVLYSQNEKMLTDSGAIPEAVNFQLDISKNMYEIVKTQPNDSIAPKISSFLDKYLLDHKDSKVLPFILNKMTKQQFLLFSTPWLREYVRLDPIGFLSNTTCPVLALNGTKDTQVISEINLRNIKSALKDAGNKDVTIKEFEGLNHLFQTAETGMLNEYAKIEETISPDVLLYMKDWILERF